MKSNPIFGFPIPVFPIQYATFTELSLTIRGVSYSLPCKMIAFFGPLKNGFGAKKEDLTPGQIDPKGIHPPPKHVFGCTERKSTLLRVSCGRIERTKKKLKSTREYNFTHMPTPPSIFGGYHILHVGSDCGRDHTCQISSESVQGFLSSRWPKMTTPIDLARRPYNSVRTNVLHCDPRTYVAPFPR